MHWLQNEFKLYCNRKNIRVLRDDMRFIERRLLDIPENDHRRVMREYVRIWLDELAQHQNQNKARKKANEYLCCDD